MDASKISFWFYSSLIIIIVVVTFFIIHLIKKGELDQVKIDKITEIFKYSIGTTAIATATLIISDIFKEREVDKADMITFNTYIPYIVDSTSTIEKKIYFCKFFSLVTPKGDLKDGWKEYENFLTDEKNKLETINKKNREEANKSDQANNPASSEQMNSLKNAEEQKAKVLSNTNTTENSSYLVILGADKSLNDANPELVFAKKINPNAVIYKKGSWFRTVIPVFTNFEDAKSIAATIKQKDSLKESYVVSLKTWCTTTVFSTSENCTICN